MSFLDSTLTLITLASLFILGPAVGYAVVSCFNWQNWAVPIQHLALEISTMVAVSAIINLSQVFAGQTVGIKQTDDRIWLVSSMDYDLGYFDDETCRLEPLANPFGPKVLPMSSE
jgi:hypothetical protein